MKMPRPNEVDGTLRSPGDAVDLLDAMRWGEGVCRSCFLLVLFIFFPVDILLENMFFHTYRALGTVSNSALQKQLLKFHN